MDDEEPKSRLSLRSEETQSYSLEQFLAEIEPMEERIGTRIIGPPVDYSFRDIKNIEALILTDVCKVDPRDSAHPYETIDLDIPEQEALAEKEKKENDDGKKTKFVKYCSNAIRMGNNDISSLENLSTTLKAVIDEPEALEWIDLSFNYLSTIDESLLEYQNLKVLYLHANNIDNIKEIDKLAALPNLKTLTLHGNMFENVKGYRQYVISVLPQIDYLDFSRITKADRDKSATWKKLRLIAGQRHKKRPKAEA